MIDVLVFIASYILLRILIENLPAEVSITPTTLGVFAASLAVAFIVRFIRKK